MPIDRYGQIAQIVPLLAPINITTSATYSKWVNLGGAHRCTFLLHIGVFTSTSIDQPVTVYVKAASTAATTLAVAIAGKYRLSGPVATDTWGAVTTLAATGLALEPTGGAAPVGAACDLLIDIAPQDVVAGPVSGLGKYAAVYLVPDAGVTALNVAVTAILEPRFIQTSPVSSS